MYLDFSITIGSFIFYITIPKVLKNYRALQTIFCIGFNIVARKTYGRFAFIWNVVNKKHHVGFIRKLYKRR